jgi:predicted ribosomally synthesized peptide with nif11-like leader
MYNQLSLFIAHVKDSLELQQLLGKAESPSDIVAIAKECGFEIEVSDIVNGDQLSDSELESISGGATPGALAIFAVKVGINYGMGQATITLACMGKVNPGDKSWIDMRIDGPD